MGKCILSLLVHIDEWCRIQRSDIVMQGKTLYRLYSVHARLGRHLCRGRMVVFEFGRARKDANFQTCSIFLLLIHFLAPLSTP